MLGLLTISMLETANATSIDEEVKAKSETFTLIYNEKLEKLLEAATQLAVVLAEAVPYFKYLCGTAVAFLFIKEIYGVCCWGMETHGQNRNRAENADFSHSRCLNRTCRGTVQRRSL